MNIAMHSFEYLNVCMNNVWKNTNILCVLRIVRHSHRRIPNGIFADSFIFFLIQDYRKSVLNMNVDDRLKDEFGRRQEEMRRHRKRHTNNLTTPDQESSSATPSSSDDEGKQDSRKPIKKSPSRSGKLVDWSSYISLVMWYLVN